MMQAAEWPSDLDIENLRAKAENPLRSAADRMEAYRVWEIESWCKTVHDGKLRSHEVPPHVRAAVFERVLSRMPTCKPGS